jgi:hypothetical protein
MGCAPEVSERILQGKSAVNSSQHFMKTREIRQQSERQKTIHKRLLHQKKLKNAGDQECRRSRMPEIGGLSGLFIN